jgi:hypothetical protein
VLRRHVVLVIVDDLNLAAARALQYARTLTPDELRAVHFDLDPIRTEDLAAAWSRLGLSRVALEIRELPDRRLNRAVLQLVAGELVQGDTEVSVLVPRIRHTRAWHRILHDRTADSIVETLADLPHCNVTIVPYHLRAGASKRHVDVFPPAPAPPPSPNGNGDGHRPGGTPDVVAHVPAVPGSTPIGDVEPRRKVQITGRVVAVRVQPWGGAATLEATLSDGSGQIVVVFLGRRQVGGVKPGALMTVEGVLGAHGSRVAMLNPVYTFLPQHTAGH